LKRDIAVLVEMIDQIEVVSKEEISKEEKQLKINSLKKSNDYDYLKSEIDHLIKGINEGASRTAEIVKGLRVFSRLDEDDLKRADINEGLKSTIVIINHLLNNIIEVETHFANLPMIECYPGKLNQVFLNIMSNAIYAIQKKWVNEKGGKLIIETTDGDNNIIIKISDNGTGMDENTKKKIFDPFFTTKDVGEGTGLGMSIAYNTIKKHNGTIEVFSEQNQGASFIITLPFLQV
jgi:signal transduction histidine kinase